MLLIAGSWGSGTTALAGALTAMGVHNPQPWFGIKDAKHPNSYESNEFRDLVLKYVDEQRLAVDRSNPEALHTDLERINAWGGDPMLLKLPAASLLIPELARAIPRLRLVVLMRDFNAIEQSRARRGWPPVYGAAGAQQIYAAIVNAVLGTRLDALFLHYENLRVDPATTLMQVCQFCGWDAKVTAHLEKGVRFIK